MDGYAWLQLGSCVGQVALVALLIGRGRQSPLVRPLALLCLDFFAFNAADVASRFSPARGWNLLDATASSLLTPIALDLFLVFTGHRRSFAWLRWASRIGFGAIALACALGFVAEPFARFAGSDHWALVMLVGTVPLLGLIVVLLVAELRRATDPIERRRVHLMFAALGVGSTSVTDLFANMGYDVPHLSAIGTLGATVVLTIAALRLDLVVAPRRGALWLAAAGVGALQVAAYLAVYHWLRSSTAMVILASATVTLAAAPMARELLRVQGEARERERELKLLGRLAQEMAHSVLNPLASIKGSAEIVLAEQARGGPIEKQRRFLETILVGCARLERLVKDYQRLSKVEPYLAREDVNELVATVAAGQAAAAPAGISIRTVLADALPGCDVDRDLIEAALENLVKNAFDAMPGGGTLTLRTRLVGRDVWIAVEDTGTGMDPWVAECAFDEFYTTKAHGSGLGLAYVRRVAEAHGGNAKIDSRAGAGTTVELSLQAPRAP